MLRSDALVYFKLDLNFISPMLPFIYYEIKNYHYYYEYYYHL